MTQVTTLSLAELTKQIEILTDKWHKNMTTHPTKWVTQIRDLGDKDYRLLEPVMIIVEEYANEETINARWPEIELLGEGKTEVEALANLKLAILDLYDELAETPPIRLGSLPQGWLRVLQRLITKVDSTHEMA